LIDAPLAVECDMVDVNCSAVLAMSWHFARRFAARRRGGLVLISSLLAFHGVPRAANYAATKAYVQTLAEGLRVELAPFGVDVVASAPGPIRSGFAERADMKMALSLEPEVVARLTLRALGRRTTVRPGWLSKLLGWSLARRPRHGGECATLRRGPGACPGAW
jgi:short-subunit dehydrogenase